MKRLVILSAGVMMGCTITVKPIPPDNSAKHSTHHYATKSSHATQNGSSNIKETWWIENYHKLEAARGNYVIKADDDIEPLPNGKFRVPDLVLTHYQDLLLASTPTPTPSY